MKVYIVQQGDDSEGGSIIGVYSARSRALALVSHYIVQDKCEWTEIRPYYWHDVGGCSWLTVTEHEVQTL